MRLSDITALARPVDPTYATNRAIAGLSLLAMVAGGAYRLWAGETLVQSLAWGAGAGLALFLAWALARELDPDHDLSAFVAAGLAGLGLVLWALPELLGLFWLLLTLRLVNRTPGLPARPLDSLGVLGLGSWLVWQGDWPAGLITALAFLLDGWLRPPFRRHLLFAGLAMVLLGVLTFFSGEPVMVAEASPLLYVTLAAITVLFAIVIATSGRVRSVGDETGEQLNPRRIQAAQVLALLTGLLFSWWRGQAGALALVPLWAAVLGVTLFRLVVLLKLSAVSR